ncbi:MAG: HEAT repeat domain-containing protein [Acidobacteriota bacterium]
MRLTFIGLIMATLLLALTASAQLEPLVQTLEHGDAEQRRSALASIRNLRSESASRIAIPSLRDSNVLVRATAASSVIFLPPSEAASVLIPMLGDRDEFVRREAAFALGEVGDASAVAPLLALLGREKAIEVRSAAVIGLGGTGDASTIGPLLSVLAKKPVEDDEFLRRSAARAIGRIAQFVRTGTRDVVTPQNFLPDRFKDLKTPVTFSSTQNSVFQPAIAQLLKVLNSLKESEDTRREAAFALGAIGDASALPDLRSKIRAADIYMSEIAKEAVLKIEAASRQ